MSDRPRMRPTIGATERRRPTTTSFGGPRPVLDRSLLIVLALWALAWAGLLTLLEVVLTGT
jgi:hypothetical protein